MENTKKRILIVHNKEINYYPPVKTLINVLLESGHQISVITYDAFGYQQEKSGNHNIRIYNIADYKNKSKVGRLFNFFKVRNSIQQLVIKLMIDHDVIWTTTDNTVSLLGKKLYQYDNHIMQLMELVEDTPILYYSFAYKTGINKVLKAGLKNYAHHAARVVVPEENRAHILKAMWDLDRMPDVLPNKPYIDKEISANGEVNKIAESLQGLQKKIILYQGVFLKERKLDEFAEAIRVLGDEYVFCIMGADTEERKALCRKYPEIIYIPFITPPMHLVITKLAYIGILTYFPTSDSLAGKLNILFCAPNKIYEYAYSGLPMVGNNIPGLKNPFEKYHIGCCFNSMDAESIAAAIRNVEKNYLEMKANCLKFYEDIDLPRIVQSIIE